MSKNLERKLLAECFDAIVNDGDIAKATRLFKRHWDLTAKSQYSLLESADEDFGVNDMGEDFNDEMIEDAGSENEEKMEQALLAVDELEDKYTGEDEEIQPKFDELRNIIDEMKLSESEDASESCEDASVVIEDLKAEFEVAGCMDDEVADLFDEIESAVCGGQVSEEEVDVADEEPIDEEPVEESVDEEPAEEDMGTDIEFEDANVEPEGDAEELDVDDTMGEDLESPEESDDVLYDIKDDVEELLAKLEELEGGDESVEEGFEKVADPRKKMTSEEEGVNKKGTMNFGKLRGMTLDKKAGLGTSASDSKGTSADKKAKVQSVDNKGAKSWHKVEKPSNKPADGKSLMGKK